MLFCLSAVVVLFASTGSMFVSSLEVGGIIGSISAGFVADRLVALVSLLTCVYHVTKSRNDDSYKYNAFIISLETRLMVKSRLADFGKRQPEHSML